MQNLSEKERREAFFALPLIGAEQAGSQGEGTELARTGTRAVKRPAKKNS
jgi:hypothetical protein